MQVNPMDETGAMGKPTRRRQPRCGDYGYRNKAGGPCGAVPLSGTRTCKTHAGIKTARAKANGQIRRAVLAWDPDAPLVDPGETLLRLLTVTFARARMLADLLQRAYDAAEALASAELAAVELERRLDGEADDSTGSKAAAVDTARSMLGQVLATGGVAALVGRTRAGDGKGSTIETGEQIRALAALEQSERKLAADLAAKAVAAGIAERQVRMAERQADVMNAIIIGALRRLGQDADAQAVSDAVYAEMIELPSGVTVVVPGSG